MLKKLNHEDYTVGWICPLEVEQIAALEMLDEEHERLTQSAADHNVYNLGCIAGHNVVVAGLHNPGNNPAATVVTQMRMTFPNLRFGLLVGIGGGVPVMTDNGMIRLGDVVVSKPADTHSGAVQYDHGKATAGFFQRTGALAPPPTVLLNAAQDLAAKRARSRQDPIEDNIKRIDTSIRGLRKYQHPGIAQDRLFRAEYVHVKDRTSCAECDPSQMVQRHTSDEDDEPYVVVHRGTVASGNLVIKDAGLRDLLADEYSLLCFETEAAGALADFPCIVIRGISDYCDSHKNDQWHGYAAAAAAAYARQLCFHMPRSEVKRYISETAETNIAALKQRQHAQDQRSILDWITPIDYGPQHSDIFKRREPDTGEWFLISEVYQTWLNKSSQTLFCPGIPGTGKTILTSIVINDLRTKFQIDTTIGMAYIYFNFQRRDEQTVDELLASILKQLAQGHSPIPQEVQKLYDIHNTRRTRPSFDEISKALRSIIGKYSRTFIIFDALDECQAYEADGSRAKFLSEVFKLQEDTGTNILATSRFIPEIIERFRDSVSMEIRASREDIKRYVESHIEQLPSFIHRIPKLQKEISDTISEAVDGMFLLAQIYLTSLDDKVTPKAVRTSLKDFQKQGQHLSEDERLQVLTRAYGQAMERIMGQKSGLRQLALQVLTWITCAKRPLNKFEVQAALAVESNQRELDEDNLPQIEDMVSVCVGLVTIDEDSNVIRLVHYTTQEYFNKMQNHWFPNAQLEITSICTTYLSFQYFDNGPCQTDAEFEKRITSYPLYDYAAHNWGFHSRAANMIPTVLSFLKRQAHVAASFQALLALKKWPRRWRFASGYSQSFPKQMTGLHLAAFFGLEEVAKVLSNEYEIDGKDTDGNTPLWWAVMNGHLDTIQQLVKQGADIEAKDVGGRTPLMWAVTNRRLDTIQLLVKKGANINIQGLYGETPLLWAAGNGDLGIVQLLATRGADIEALDIRAMTPLLHAATNGNIDIVQLLVNKGSNIEAKDVRGRTPLWWAARNNHLDTLQLLVTNGADIEPKDDSGGTPLLWASKNRHLDTVKLLLEKGASIEAKDERGRTPLRCAVESRHLDTVNLLVEKGANIDAKDIRGSTPLFWAVANSHLDIIQQLVEKGVDIKVEDMPGVTPLRAAKAEQLDIVQLLVQKGANIEAKDERGRTPLCLAVENKRLDMVQLLVDKGAVVDAKDIRDRTPLLHAIMNGNLHILQLLVDKGANLEAKDIGGRTPLWWAAINGPPDIVQLLVEMGVDIEAKDANERTLLSWAVAFGKLDIVQLLIEKGANIETKDVDGRTPLSRAAEYRELHMVQMFSEKGANVEGKDISSKKPRSQVAEFVAFDLVHLLIKNGADIEAKDVNGRTPLCWAAMSRHFKVMQLLVENGADIEAKDTDGGTSLSHAAESGF